MDKNKCPNSKLKKKFIKKFLGRFLHLTEMLNNVFIFLIYLFILFYLLSRNENKTIEYKCRRSTIQSRNIYESYDNLF